MSSVIMMERIAETSPRVKARTAGFFWLMTFLTGGFAMFVGGRFVVSGDAAAIATTSFLPRILGALMVVAGLGWLTFLSPPLAKSLSPYVLAPGIVGEGLLTVWLLVKGVNVQRWNEQAEAYLRERRPPI